MNNDIFTKYKTKSKDQTKLGGNYLISTKLPSATIFLIHGLGGHSERFLPIARLFARQNYAVITIDLRGHGLSEGKQGYAKHINYLMQDIDAAVKMSEQLVAPNLPKFIYGNSMGAVLALKHAIDRKNQYAGIILTAPWFKLTKPPGKLLITALNLLSYIYPKFTISSRIKSSELRSDPVKQEDARKDALVHKRISARLFRLIHHLGEHLLYRTPKLYVPTLILHGINDPVTDSKASRLFYQSHQYNCTYLPLENALHEIHMESNYCKIFEDINLWMTKTLAL